LARRLASGAVSLDLVRAKRALVIFVSFVTFVLKLQTDTLSQLRFA
jgi:hypothetical protein